MEAKNSKIDLEKKRRIVFRIRYFFCCTNTFSFWIQTT